MISFLYTVAVDCGDLTDPTDGAVNTSSGTTFNMNATYSCNTGYNLNGTNTRTCQADRMWSGNEPSCDSTLSSLVHYVQCFNCLFFPAVVTCPALSDPDNGMVDVPNNNFGTVANYTCNTGYMLTGDVIRVCEVNGDWSGTASTCDSMLSSLVHCVHCWSSSFLQLSPVQLSLTPPMEWLMYLATTLKVLPPTPVTLATIWLEAAPPGLVGVMECGVAVIQHVLVS